MKSNDYAHRWAAWAWTQKTAALIDALAVIFENVAATCRQAIDALGQFFDLLDGDYPADNDYAWRHTFWAEDMQAEL